MNKCKTLLATWAISLSIGALGCASDDLTSPEPALETPGAFVAIDGYDAENEITLIRILDRLTLESETLLFYSIYDVKPDSWQQAREFARDPNLPLRTEIDAQPRAAITFHPWRVVWFRTLTEEEEQRAQ